MSIFLDSLFKIKQHCGIVTKRTLKQLERLTKPHGTQARIARATGIPPHSLSRILRGKRVPSWPKALLLERETGVPASEFRRPA